MAVCMNTSDSQPSTTKENSVFKSQIIESYDREKIISPKGVKINRSPSRFTSPPRSAPPVVNTTFQFGVDFLSVDGPTREAPVQRNVGDGAHILPKKSRTKSLSSFQPACLLLKQCQDRLAASSGFLTLKTFSSWKLRFMKDEGLPFSTLPPELPSSPYPLGTGVSRELDDTLADVSLMSGGSKLTVPSTPVICVRTPLKLGNSPGKFCRICHEATGPLISPCLCAGSVALIHKACLEHWLTQTRSSCCEICKFDYTVEYRPMPYCRVFRDSNNSKLRRSILTDLACFVGLTPLALAAICLCLLGAMQNMTTDVDGKLDPTGAKAQEASRQWEAGWLIFLAVMLLAVYIVWFSFTFNNHMKTWALWRKASLRVKLLDVKSLRQSQARVSSDASQSGARLAMNDASTTASDGSIFNIHFTSVPMRAQSISSSSLDRVPSGGSGQDSPTMSSTPANGRPLRSSFEGTGPAREDVSAVHSLG